MIQVLITLKVIYLILVLIIKINLLKSNLENNENYNENINFKNLTTNMFIEKEKDETHISEETKEESTETDRDEENKSLDITRGEKEMIYLNELEFRIQFLLKIFELSLDCLEIRHVKLLWELLVINSICEQEKDIFFNFFNSLIYSTKSEFIFIFFYFY